MGLFKKFVPRTVKFYDLLSQITSHTLFLSRVSPPLGTLRYTIEIEFYDSAESSAE